MKTLKLALGRYDDPERQEQKHYTVDLYGGNLAIFGGAMSGKTTLLKTLLLRIHQMAGLTHQEEIYILDFSNDLEQYQHLPYVSAYFDGLQEENVRRIFQVVERKYADNLRALPGKTYAQAGEDAPPHVTFVLDGLNTFLAEDRWSAYHDSLQRLARDGLSKGITVIFTASEPSGAVGRLLPSFRNIVAFDLPKDKYADLFSMRVEKPVVRRGRGLVNIEEAVYEFQAYFPYNSDILGNSEADEINYTACRLMIAGCDLSGLKEKPRELSTETLFKQLSGNARNREVLERNREFLGQCAAKKLKSFTTPLTRNKWKHYTGQSWEDYSAADGRSAAEWTVGLDYYTFAPIRIDLAKTRAVAIYGKKQSGKSSLLSLLLETVSGIPGVRFVLWEDGRRALRDSEAVTDVLGRVREENVEWVESKEGFENYLRKAGYYDFPEITRHPISSYRPGSDTEARESFCKKDNPYTVFVIQSRLFYQAEAGGFGTQWLMRLAPFIGEDDGTNQRLFVFSDVKRITNPEACACFNNCIDHAFLLDDIRRFVNDRGRQSVFGAQDPQDLKERFGGWGLGDGFYLDMEKDELRKLKLILNTGDREKR